MDEQNPLYVCSPKKKTKISNRCGRPRMKNLIQFGPQPKSIVAQMLSEMKAVKTSCDDNKVEIICLDEQSEDALDIDKSEEHICSICTYRSNNEEEYTEHLTKHKKFQCDFPNCRYSCKLVSNLIKHKRVHTNEKPYLCDTCCFRSNFISSLKVHKRTHTNERPYQCEQCTYKCNSSSNLKKHCRHRHPDTLSQKQPVC